jgi:sensor histidine kinase YesM
MESMESPVSPKVLIVSTILACLFLGGLNMYVVNQYGFYWSTAFKDAAVSVFFWLLGALIIGNTIRHYFPRQSRIVFFLGLIITLTAVWATLSGLLLHFIQRKTLAYSGFFELSLPVRVSFTLLIFTAVAMIFAFLYTITEQQMIEQRNAEAEKLSRETELNNLQEKLHPHFLFNSLNSISALVAIQPERARQMVLQLSDFLRGTLKRESDEWITLKQELEYLSLYLDIEKVRFGHRLQTAFQIEPGTEETKLPPFILLPLLENAIKFGLYDTLDDIHIVLKIIKIDELLKVSISNPFDPSTSGKVKGTGFGLKSVNRRLFLLFGRSELLSTHTDSHIFTTTVLIPLNK